MNLEPLITARGDRLPKRLESICHEEHGRLGTIVDRPDGSPSMRLESDGVDARIRPSSAGHLLQTL